jgi:hypothetical protein
MMGIRGMYSSPMIYVGEVHMMRVTELDIPSTMSVGGVHMMVENE